MEKFVFVSQDYFDGEVAYESYRNQTGGVSLVSMQQLPGWEELRDEIQAAWIAAARAVLAVDSARRATERANIFERAIEAVERFNKAVLPHVDAVRSLETACIPGEVRTLRVARGRRTCRRRCCRG